MKRQALQIIIPMFACVCLLLGSVKTDFDRNADFGRYRTYSWIGVAKASDDLWSERIMQDVDQQLRPRVGPKSNPAATPPSPAFGRTHNEQTLDTFYTDIGGGWRWRGGFGDAMTMVENTPVGTLIVDVFDAASKKLVWRGTATDTLSGHPDKNEKKLEHAVADMFKNFPPSRG